MYYKDKTEVFKLRLTPEQLDFVTKVSKDMGVSKSVAMRVIIDTYRSKAVQYENK